MSQASKGQQDYFNSPEFDARYAAIAADYPELSESQKVAAAENAEHSMDMEDSWCPERWLELYAASLEGIHNEVNRQY